jgi:hypothetical protein
MQRFIFETFRADLLPIFKFLLILLLLIFTIIVNIKPEDDQ